MHRLLMVGCALALPLSSSANGIANDTAARCAADYIAARDQGRGLPAGDACDWTGSEDPEDMQRADRIQDRIREQLVAASPAVGYKVTFAEDGRVVGVLTEDMLRKSPATIELSSGNRLLVEADLLVRVASAEVNAAASPAEVAAHIDVVIPFLESSNIMLPRGTARKRAVWTATNGNARWGTVGQPVRVDGLPPEELASMLGELTATLMGPDDKELQQSGMSRHPLQSVLDVAQDLTRRGQEGLKAGDLVSVGNFGRPRFPKPGESYSARFDGLPGEAEVIRATFE